MDNIKGTAPVGQLRYGSIGTATPPDQLYLGEGFLVVPIDGWRHNGGPKSTRDNTTCTTVTTLVGQLWYGSSGVTAPVAPVWQLRWLWYGNSGGSSCSGGVGCSGGSMGNRLLRWMVLRWLEAPMLRWEVLLCTGGWCSGVLVASAQVASAPMVGCSGRRCSGAALRYQGPGLVWSGMARLVNLWYRETRGQSLVARDKGSISGNERQ